MAEKRELRRQLPDGSSWPTIEEADRLNWLLRYGEPTRNDLLGAAAYCDAFAEMIRVTEAKRRMVVRTLKSPPTQDSK